MVSIILVSYNVGEVTKACIESIYNNVTIPYEIIVVDNNSNQETISMLEDISGIKLIKNDSNVGFPAACNIGLAASKGDLIWFLNNDTIVPPGSLERMVELILNDARIGIVGPVTNSIDGKQQITVNYNDESSMYEFADMNMKKHKGETWNVVRLIGFSMLTRKSTLDIVGGFDERMGTGIFEDDDLCLRCIEMGFTLIVARDAFIHHLGSTSFKAAGGFPKGGSRNQYIVSCRHGMTIPIETTVNIRAVMHVGREACRILHVECGAGAYGLQAMEEGVYIEALESSKKKLQIAKNNYNRISLYEPGYGFEYDGENLDCVVMEKQYRSDYTLEIVKSILPSILCGARIIIHTPYVLEQWDGQYRTYMENWSENGCITEIGCFEFSIFIDEMIKLGFKLVRFEMNEIGHGFLNRNAYERYLKNEHGYKEKSDWFMEALYIFDYVPNN